LQSRISKANTTYKMTGIQRQRNIQIDRQTHTYIYNAHNRQAHIRSDVMVAIGGVAGTKQIHPS